MDLINKRRSSKFCSKKQKIVTKRRLSLRYKATPSKISLTMLQVWLDGSPHGSHEKWGSSYWNVDDNAKASAFSSFFWWVLCVGLACNMYTNVLKNNAAVAISLRMFPLILIKRKLVLSSSLCCNVQSENLDVLIIDDWEIYIIWITLSLHGHGLMGQCSMVLVTST